MATIDRPIPGDALAVLTSGGLDSAVLLAESLRGCAAVYPIYVRTGLYWEAVELQYLRRFLEAVRRPVLEPLAILELPVADLYGPHWSITGQDVPRDDSADDEVYLPGRNVLLLAKAMLWCHLQGVQTLALAVLEANPFPDATPAFFAAFQDAVNQAVEGHVRVVCPYAGLGKVEVVRRGRGLPLELTFSCLRPVEGRHCGRCNKCAERQRAFTAAGVAGRSDYHSEGACTG
jgi:7-cyano-7-deazaguanine synthase